MGSVKLVQTRRSGRVGSGQVSPSKQKYQVGLVQVRSVRPNKKIRSGWVRSDHFDQTKRSGKVSLSKQKYQIRSGQVGSGLAKKIGLVQSLERGRCKN